MRDTSTVWVCVDCIMHLANGECGGCYDDEHDCEPLGLILDYEPTPGMTQEQHDCGRQDDTYFGECDCEVISFSWSQCSGCGSTLGGKRHAVTLWF